MDFGSTFLPLELLVENSNGVANGADGSHLAPENKLIELRGRLFYFLWRCLQLPVHILLYGRLLQHCSFRIARLFALQSVAAIFSSQ